MIVGANTYSTIARLGGMEGIEGYIDISSYLNHINKIIEEGFHYIEIFSDPLLTVFNRYQMEELTKYLFEYKKTYNVAYSLHLPFWWGDIGSFNEYVREGTVQTITELIEYTRILEPAHYVVHTLNSIPARIQNSHSTNYVKQENTKKLLVQTEKSLRSILSLIDQSEKLCVENLYEADFALNTVLMETLNMGICFDIGHLAMRNEDIFEFLDKYLPKIKVIHAHNVVPEINRNRQEWALVDHLSVDQGIVNYLDIIQYLDRFDFQGVFLIEVRAEKFAKSSFQYLEDLKKNHSIILQYKPQLLSTK